MFQYQNGQSLDALEDAPADTPKNNQIISLLINNLIESTYFMNKYFIKYLAAKNLLPSIKRWASSASLGQTWCSPIDPPTICSLSSYPSNRLSYSSQGMIFKQQGTMREPYPYRKQHLSSSEMKKACLFIGISSGK